LDDLTYSPISGECYKSRASGNSGNDPSQGGVKHPLPPQQVQVYAPGAPGSPAQSKLIQIALGISIPGPNPPTTAATGSVFQVSVYDGPDISTANVIGTSTQTLGSPTLLSAIVTQAASDLTGTLPGSFTVAADTTLYTIQLTNASDFYALQAYWLQPSPNNLTHHNFNVSQINAYIPSISSIPAKSNQISITLSNTDVLPGWTYYLNFLDANGPHSIQYTSAATDGLVQILGGLASAIAVQTTDPFLNGLQSRVVGSTMTFSLPTTFSLDSYATLAGSSVWWEYIAFPFVLVDQVLQGIEADNMREQGQTDKADAQEAKVPTLEQLRVASVLAPQYNRLTDQAKPRSRYQVT